MLTLCLPLLAAAVSAATLASAGGALPPPHGTDESECDNCELLSGEAIDVPEEDRIDFDAIAPERRLDFLEGTWVLYYPEQRRGTEVFSWLYRKETLHAFQDWRVFGTDDSDFFAHSYYRYVADEDRYQFVWIATRTYSVFSGGWEDGNTLAFYEYTWSGDARALALEKRPVRYVFTNISRDQFLVEWQEDRDGDGVYEKTMWRVLMRREVGASGEVRPSAARGQDGMGSPDPS